jgi:phosphatidylserine/phosphatidylglycerophosphate/cardiolipin synthase-like enzyme
MQENPIHLQTYIYDEDETGRVVAEALIHAAEQRRESFFNCRWLRFQGTVTHVYKTTRLMAA